MSENRRRPARVVALVPRAQSRDAHLSSEDLALYVIDALEDARKERVERHVFACEACADALAREACVEAAFEQVARIATAREGALAEAPFAEARLAGGAETGRVMALVPAIPSAEARARLASGGRRSRWAGGVGGALAAAAALVLAFASATARSEPAGVAQRAPGLHDAAGDMSGAFAGGGGGATETVLGDALDGG